MEGWANVKRHVAEEITLLCDQHHKEKTNGLLPPEKVRQADRDPYNLREGVSKPYNLHFSGQEAIVVIGGNRFVGRYQGYGTALVPLWIDGAPIIGMILGDDHLLLNLVVFDEFNNPLLHIKNNQLYYRPEPWDIQFVGTTLIVREASRKILIEITFHPPNRIEINRGRFLRNGVEVLIRPDNLLITNNNGFLSGCEGRGTGGFILGHGSFEAPCMVRIANIPRYLGDRREALRFEQECIEAMKAMANNAMEPTR
jgi:hypothetical protein